MLFLVSLTGGLMGTLAIDALDVQLSADEVASLSAAIPVGAASGTRYPAGAMKAVDLAGTKPCN